MEIIRKIYHVGDIHCRLFQRHVEYFEVFDNLFEEISNSGTDDAAIVIVGDIVHGKTDMSPELIALVSYLLVGCAELCTTIVIPGNHDTNLTNSHRMDALSPIVDAIGHDNLHYWMDSGIYHMGGIEFRHYSVFGGWDKIVPEANTTSIARIGLYHGAVSGAVTDIGFDEFSDSIPVTTFTGCDITLLGDIHKTQYLDVGKTIAYCGSLIQQNHGELPTRGILVWDVLDRSSEFVAIKNSYTYLTIDVDGGMDDLRQVLNETPDNINLRLTSNVLNKEELRGIYDKIKTDYSIRGIQLKPSNKSRGTTHVEVDDIIHSRDSKVQMKLFKEFLIDTDIDDQTWSRIEKINNDLNSELRNVEMSARGIRWKPMWFKFSNMFSYGEDNTIDFMTLNGIIGLFAPNAYGKSTLLDALTYCIFDKCSKTSKAGLILNNKSTEFECEFHFMIGSDEYTIRRHGVKQTNGSVKVAVEFTKYIEGVSTNLTGKRRDDTNRIIRDYIGSYDDFVLTTLSTQNDNRSFVDMTQKERQELLYRFLDIHVFTDLYKLAKDQSKDLLAISKTYAGHDYEKLIEDITHKLTEETASLQQSTQSRDAINDSIDEYTTRIEKLLSQIRHIEVSDSLEMLEDNARLISSTIATKLKSLGEISDEVIKHNKTIDEYTVMISTVDTTKLQSDLVAVDDLIVRQDMSKGKIRVLRTKLGHLMDTIEKLHNHEYDPDCEYCVKNQFVIDAKLAGEELPNVEKQIIELEASIDTTLVTQREDIKNKISAHNSVMDRINVIRVSINTCEQRIESLGTSGKYEEGRLAMVNKQISTHQHRVEIIKQNGDINNKVEVLKSSRKMDMETRSHYTTSVSDTQNSINNSELELRDLLRRLKESNKVQDEYRAYEYYLSAVNRSGIPFMILTRILPIIENEVNEVLSDMVNFTFKLSIGDNDTVDGFIDYGGDMWAIELSSGMERFVLSTAIRVSLINLSGLPKPNFLAIDEGFGVLDTDKINSIHILFEFLKKQFDFILCISHISELKDYVDQPITINKLDGRSKISIM